MSVIHALVRLHPRPFRDRWGGELESEAAIGGRRSWPDLLASLVRLWLHPAVWPAESRAQRRARAATMAVAVAAVGWLTGHAAAELSNTLPLGLTHSPILTACDLLTMFGLALVMPVPRLTRSAAAAVLGQAARRLAVPVALGTSMVWLVNSGLHPETRPVVRSALLACWWVALSAGAVQSVRTVAGLGLAVVIPPTPARLRLGFWMVAATLAVNGATVVGATLRDGDRDPLTFGAGVVLLALTAAAVVNVRDLADLSPVDRQAATG